MTTCLSSLPAHREMPFDKQNSRENSKTCVINRIMHGNRKRHKTERNVREPGFRITDTLYMAHRGKAPCTVLAWRGSTRIPCKCWRSLDLSLSPRDGGWLFVRFPASLRLACLSWPSSASLKMRCPGWFTPREGLSTQICASPYGADILTIFTQHSCLFLYWKLWTSKNKDRPQTLKISILVFRSRTIKYQLLFGLGLPFHNMWGFKRE